MQDEQLKASVFVAEMILLLMLLRGTSLSLSQIYSYIYATFPYEDWQQLDGSDISSTIENNPAALFQASSPINNPIKDIKGSTVSVTSMHQQL